MFESLSNSFIRYPQKHSIYSLRFSHSFIRPNEPPALLSFPFTVFLLLLFPSFFFVFSGHESSTLVHRFKAVTPHRHPLSHGDATTLLLPFIFSLFFIFLILSIDYSLIEYSFPIALPRAPPPRDESSALVPSTIHNGITSWFTNLFISECFNNQIDTSITIYVTR